MTATDEGPLVVEDRDILERLPVAVLVVDRERLLRYANRAAQRFMFSFQAQARVGRPLPQLDLEPSLETAVETLVTRGVLAPRQYVSPDNRMFVVSGAFSKRHAVAILQVEEVTSQERRLEVERQFVVNAAHEFLSPLTTIVSSTQVLESGGKERPEIRDLFIGHIASAANHLITVSRALLTLARAEAAVEPPRIERFAIEPLLHEVAESCRTSIPVEVVASAAFVVADRDLLELALTIVAENACRHTHEGKIRIMAMNEKETIRIEISDSGAGIPAEMVEHVTGRFTRGGGRDSEGFGIGLSIAERALQVTGGTLSIASSSEGTNVIVRLPIDPEAAA